MITDDTGKDSIGKVPDPSIIHETIHFSINDDIAKTETDVINILKQLARIGNGMVASMTRAAVIEGRNAVGVAHPVVQMVIQATAQVESASRMLEEGLRQKFGAQQVPMRTPGQGPYRA